MTSRRPWPPGGLRWSMRADHALAGICCVVGQIEVAVDGADPVRVLGAALATLPIAWRRQAPLIATLVVAVSWTMVKLWDGFGSEPPFYFFAALPVIYSLGAYARTSRALAGAGLVLAIIVATDLPGTADDYVFLAFLIILVWLCGRGSLVHRRQSEQLRVLASVIETEHADSERLAVAEERQRVVGMLNNVIEQAVRRMRQHADDAERLIGTEPEGARAAVMAVQDIGRKAMSELHGVLCLLRTPDSPAAFPEPALPPTKVPGECRPLGSRWIDVCTAVGLTLAFDAQHLLGGAGVLGAGSAAVACLAMALRRRAPLTALTLASVALVLTAADGATVYSPAVAFIVTTCSLAVQPAWHRWTLVGAATVLTADFIVIAWTGIGNVTALATLLAILWIAGRSVRVYRQRAERLRMLTVRLTRERDARARLAVLDERARVTRDLHDSVGHAVSIMVLQAGAAEQVLDTSPDSALTAVRFVQAQGARAHRDLRPLLDETVVPQPIVSQLDELATRTGLPVALRVRGQPARLPTAVSISAYRIVQEGLTNTLKHAGLVPTTVTVDCGLDALDIEIRDRGTCLSHRPAGTFGNGLRGMRERVTRHGGTLEAGPRPDGGFVVHAHIPLSVATETAT